mgnify:CR=1 FL=1
MSAPQILFWANILILVPIGFVTLLKPSVTDQGAFVESAGWRALVGSLWLAILVCSVLGVVSPASFLWLLVFALFRGIIGNNNFGFFQQCVKVELQV